MFPLPVVAENATAVLESFDRMPENKWLPDACAMRRMLKGRRRMTLVVVSCPPINAKYLKTKQPEKFFPFECNLKRELILQRLEMLGDILSALSQLGITVDIFFLVGDGMLEYWGPVLDVVLDEGRVGERRGFYLPSFEKQMPFYQGVSVSSVTELGITSSDTKNLDIPKELLEKVIASSKRTYEGFYKPIFNKDLTEEDFVKVATVKIQQYVAIAEALLKDSGAILLATGGSDTLDSWLLDVLLYDLGGYGNLYAIFPWIRPNVPGVIIREKEKSDKRRR